MSHARRFWESKDQTPNGKEKGKAGSPPPEWSIHQTPSYSVDASPTAVPSRTPNSMTRGRDTTPGTKTITGNETLNPTPKRLGKRLSVGEAANGVVQSANGELCGKNGDVAACLSEGLGSVSPHAGFMP